MNQYTPNAQYPPKIVLGEDPKPAAMSPMMLGLIAIGVVFVLPGITRGIGDYVTRRIS